MNDKIFKVLERGTLAPSGDNCQPWKLEVDGSAVRLFNLPDKDTSLYNYRQKASLIAHGAFLENIAIAAPEFGLQAEFELFPDPENKNLVARIFFTEAEASAADPLFDYLEQRSTNRKAYRSAVVSQDQRQALAASVADMTGISLYLSKDQQEKDELAGILAKNDHLVLENPNLHRFLFDHLRWSEEEVRRTADGMDIRSLELPLMDRLAFKFLRNWNTVQLMNSFQALSKKVTKQAEHQCRSAGIIGLVAVEGVSDNDFIKGGRAMQRVWLEATRQGLQLQPMAGLALLICRVRQGATDELETRHVEMIRDVDKKLSQIFGCGDETMIMLFRAGEGEPPSVESLRKPLDQVVTVKS